MARIIFIWFSLGLIACELRNTGTRPILTQFWTEKYWNTTHFDSLWTEKYWNTNHFDHLWTEKYWNTNQFDSLWCMTGGRTDGRPGRVTGTFAKESILGICILKNLNIVYIIESWLLDMFTKKTRAEKWWNLAAVSRRDLSYETDSGPKTKTVETLDLAYYFFIVIFFYSSASVIFFIVIFY